MAEWRLRTRRRSLGRILGAQRLQLAPETGRAAGPQPADGQWVCGDVTAEADAPDETATMLKLRWTLTQRRQRTTDIRIGRARLFTPGPSQLHC